MPHSGHERLSGNPQACRSDTSWNEGSVPFIRRQADTHAIGSTTHVDLELIFTDQWLLHQLVANASSIGLGTPAASASVPSGNGPSSDCC
jgi:hypothetical protein